MTKLILLRLLRKVTVKIVRPNPKHRGAKSIRFVQLWWKKTDLTPQPKTKGRKVNPYHAFPYPAIPANFTPLQTLGRSARHFLVKMYFTLNREDRGLKYFRLPGRDLTLPGPKTSGNKVHPYQYFVCMTTFQSWHQHSISGASYPSGFNRRGKIAN